MRRRENPPAGWQPGQRPVERPWGERYWRWPTGVLVLWLAWPLLLDVWRTYGWLLGGLIVVGGLAAAAVALWVADRLIVWGERPTQGGVRDPIEPVDP